MFRIYTHAAYSYAGDWDSHDWDWEDDALGNPDWWEGGDHPPIGHGSPHQQLPSWLWFFVNGKQGLDGRDGRKGDMGEKGDCGYPGDKGGTITGPPGFDGEMGEPGDPVSINFADKINAKEAP